MKSNGLQGIFTGLLLWVVLALLVAGVLWWAFGIWPETNKGWLFILLLSPVIWVLFEAVSGILIDVIDYLLPKVRYMNRTVAQRLAEHRVKTAGAAEGMRSVLYVVRAGLAVLVIYILWQWLDHRLDMPDQSRTVESVRMWWHRNFK